MGSTYTRQSSFTDGDTITADLFNNEFDQLLAAFAVSSGHTHDGTAGEGGPITKLLGTAITIGTNGDDVALTFDGGSNDGVITWMEDEDYFHFSDDLLISTTEKIQFRDTGIYINSSVDGQLDIVADTEIQIAATTVDINGAVDISGNLGVGGNLTVTGTTTFNGGTLTLGDSASDNVVFGADVDSHIIPDDDNTYDLGSASQEWRNLFIDGTANIDSLVADTADINGGTIDGAIIGGSSTAAITGTTITGTTITGTTFVIGSASINENDLESIDGITAGTVAASKAAVVDSNKDITGFRNITLTGELDASSLDVSGNVDIDGTLETDALSINGTLITSTAGELNILDGVTASFAEINVLDGVTAGTVIASSAIVTDSNKDITGGRNITISGELDAGSLDVSGNVDIDGTLEADAITVNGVTLAETISDTVGAMVTSNTESNITVAYQDADNTLDFTVGTLNQDTTGTAALATEVTITANNTANETVYPVFVDGATGTQGLETDTGLSYNPNTNTLSVVNISVSGTQSIVDSVTMNANNAVIFEGSTVDAHETTLTSVDATADRTISLPNVSGTLPVLAVASTTAISSTPEELNILDGVTSTATELNLMDGGTSAGTTAVAGGDGIVTNDSGTMRQTTVDTFDTYLSGTTKTLTNKTLTTPVLTTPIANAGIQLKNGATSAGFLQFFEDSDNGTNKVTLIGPASTADITLTLPSAAGIVATTDDATALAIALG